MSDGNEQDADAAQIADDRVFLVVVDDTEEMNVALRFACLRAKSTGGRVALFKCIEPAEFQHWAGVGEIMREERRDEAEKLIGNLSEYVNRVSGQIPAIYVREGPISDELLKLFGEEPSISVLVLAASPSTDGPGPLISFLTGKGAAQVCLPITIVPGTLSDQQIDALT
ncbi:MAG: universal stress protein [Rhodospirillaceae bacterium]|jgi:hypothetical protein|nr:universal stress protein [Rhodospirillaceae bacterium]MBT6138313.1 universal stress protein [Rhodospirillaceae bacterium]